MSPRARRSQQMSNVVEAYPDLRFITSFTYDNKPHLTMVAGIPASYQNERLIRRDARQLFSSDTAPEVILQKAFAAEMLGKSPSRAPTKLRLPSWPVRCWGKK